MPCYVGAASVSPCFQLPLLYGTWSNTSCVPLDRQLGPPGVSGGTCYYQREGCLLLGVVGSSCPLYIALTTRWRHRLILEECKFHCGNNSNPPFSAAFPPGVSQFSCRVRGEQTSRLQGQTHLLAGDGFAARKQTANARPALLVWGSAMGSPAPAWHLQLVWMDISKDSSDMVLTLVLASPLASVKAAAACSSQHFQSLAASAHPVGWW